MSASTAQLNQTIAALEGGLISVPPATALSMIDDFEQQLQGLEASEIVSNLSALKELLTSGNATGPDIGQVLIQLGSQTTNAASDAEATVANKLSLLGQLLTQAGNSLATPKSEVSSEGLFGADI